MSPAKPPQSVLLAESAQHRLIQAAKRAHPHETGGILLGVNANGTPWITQVVEIPSDDRGRSHYRLPGGQTQAAVRAAREDDPRLGYLGEWHSHPADVGPSPTDRATMRRLTYLLQPRFGPVLIVARRTSGGYNLDVRQIMFPRLCVRGLTPTGDLNRPGKSGDSVV